jgi:hypothetical protein
MNSDSTNKLPNDVEKYDTQPGITAVLERLNALDEKWERRFSTFEGTQQEMLAPTSQAHSTIRAELRDHRRRIEQLEEQQPAIK